MLAQENDTSVWRFLQRSFQYPLFVIPAKILLSEFPEVSGAFPFKNYCSGDCYEIYKIVRFTHVAHCCGNFH